MNTPKSIEQVDKIENIKLDISRSTLSEEEAEKIFDAILNAEENDERTASDLNQVSFRGTASASF